MKKYNIINKIAFLVHEPTLFVHYSGVWEKLKTDFVIVVLGRCEQGKLDNPPRDVKEFVDRINQLGYEMVFFDEVLSRGEKYQYVVSNHCMGIVWPVGIKKVQKKITRSFKKLVARFSNKVSSKGKENCFDVYEPMQVGVKQIRFMYGADIGDGWSLQEWNCMYDLFLCHGPNDTKAIQSRFRGKTELMGYPRYDQYFSTELETSDFVSEFNIDPKKQTILWMATTGEGVCSLPGFAEPLAHLMTNYNVVVRPHPITFRNEPDYIQLLESLNYKIDSNAIRDMNKLYKIVDFVICDFGGSSFGAIYLDKNLILLDVKGSDKASTSVNSSNFELREYFPVIAIEQANKINSLLVDEELWYQQKQNRQKLFGKYFHNNRGTSSTTAAEILDNLDHFLKDG